MNITQIEGSYPQDPIPNMEEREEFVENWDAAPTRDLKNGFWNGKTAINISNRSVCPLCDWNETMHYVDDAIGTLRLFVVIQRPVWRRAPYHIYNLPELISLATGMEIDKDGLLEISRRNRNLVRAINIRRGLRRRDEKPPEDHGKKRDPEMEQKLLDAYYEFKGWNNEGIPTKETLGQTGPGLRERRLREEGDLDRIDEGVSAKETSAEKEKN